MTELQARICAAARAYDGVPWLGQGRDKRGIDCTGLAVMAHVDAGLTVDEGRVDYTAIDPVRLMRTLVKHCRRLGANEKPEPGDVVVFEFPVAGHVAVLLDGPHGLNMIHSPMFGHVEETRFDPRRGKIKGFYRWKGAS